MQTILRLFKQSKIISKYKILDYTSGSNFYFYKIQIDLIDSTIPYIREYVSETEHNYSYHWQDVNGSLIIRWDNSPHHRKLKTHPHHKHTPKLEESYETSVNEVIKFIEKKLSKLGNSNGSEKNE